MIDRVHSHSSALLHAIRVARLGGLNDAQTLRRPAKPFAQRLDTASGKKVGRAAFAAATDSDRMHVATRLRRRPVNAHSAKRLARAETAERRLNGGKP